MVPQIGLGGVNLVRSRARSTRDPAARPITRCSIDSTPRASPSEPKSPPPLLLPPKHTLLRPTHALRCRHPPAAADGAVRCLPRCGERPVREPASRNYFKNASRLPPLPLAIVSVAPSRNALVIRWVQGSIAPMEPSEKYDREAKLAQW
eukprot:SAG31_NODE_978_length_10615_cov_4.488208_10_plen_149_part_00